MYWKRPKHTMQIIKGTGREKIPTLLNPNGEFLLTLM